MKKKPFVSVVIYTRNEAKYIERCVNSILEQDYGQENFEIVLVDGLSEDGTAEIARKTANNFPNMRILTNEKRFTPFAMSIGAKAAVGEVIVLIIGHSAFPKDFISSGMKLFDKYPDAVCVGGPITSIGEGDFGTATALAMAEKIAVGNAYHRMPGYEGPSEMAWYPFYKREVYEKLGYYDERFIRNQDDEFAFRVRKAGGKIYISSTVKCDYVVRNSPGKLFKQYYYYGYYKWLGYLKHKEFISFRHIIPFLFVTTFILLFFTSIFTKNLLLFGIPALLYISTIFGYSMKFINKGIKIPIYFTFSVMILHFSYGLGFMESFIKIRKLE